MEEFEKFFVIKQQEKVQQINIQTKKDAVAIQVEEPLQNNNNQLKRKLNCKIEQRVQQQKNQSQIFIENTSTWTNLNYTLCRPDTDPFIPYIGNLYYILSEFYLNIISISAVSAIYLLTYLFRKGLKQKLD
ncbi:hypothetical protein pb186bvf_019433 [Paramecium bursaria]